MERNVRVNAAPDGAIESAPEREFSWQPAALQGEWETKAVLSPRDPSGRSDYQRSVTATASGALGAQADQGPCLYLGTAGQRCGRRATAGGFCSQHQPGAIGISVPAISGKKMAAIGVAIAMLWPEIVKVASALIRLIR